VSSADGVAVKATSEEPDAVCRGWWSEAAGERHGALFMLAGTAMGVSVTDPASGDLAPPEWVDLATVAALGVAVGAAIGCFALAVLALWCTRNRARSGSGLVRFLLAVKGVLVAALAAAAIVWTANAWLTLGVRGLWGEL